MANLNKVMLIGNMTRDIELKYLPKGTAVGEFALAINSSYKDDSGNKVEKVTFVEVTVWGRVAEIVSQYAGKGRPLYVEGRLSMDQWEDKQTGQKRQRMRVIGESIQLLGSKTDGAQRPANPHSRPEPDFAEESYTGDDRPY